jgi:glycosyltransferase involved in cell wall biosynthesis
VLVKKGDTNSIAKCIDIFLEEQKIRSDYSKRSLARAKDYAKNKIVEDYISMFERLRSKNFEKRNSKVFR